MKKIAGILLLYFICCTACEPRIAFKYTPIPVSITGDNIEYIDESGSCINVDVTVSANSSVTTITPLAHFDVFRLYHVLSSVYPQSDHVEFDFPNYDEQVIEFGFGEITYHIDQSTPYLSVRFDKNSSDEVRFVYLCLGDIDIVRHITISQKSARE